MPTLDDVVVIAHLAYREIPAVSGSLGDKRQLSPYFPAQR